MTTPHIHVEPDRATEIMVRFYGPHTGDWPDGLANSISHAIDDAVAAQRERDAKIADEATARARATVLQSWTPFAVLARRIREATP